MVTGFISRPAVPSWETPGFRCKMLFTVRFGSLDSLTLSAFWVLPAPLRSQGCRTAEKLPVSSSSADGQPWTVPGGHPCRGRGHDDVSPDSCPQGPWVSEPGPGGRYEVVACSSESRCDAPAAATRFWGRWLRPALFPPPGSPSLLSSPRDRRSGLRRTSRLPWAPGPGTCAS